MLHLHSSLKALDNTIQKNSEQKKIRVRSAEYENGKKIFKNIFWDISLIFYKIGIL